MSGDIERIGEVSCPSGRLVLLDGGWAGLWSHDRSPVLPQLPMIVGAAEDARDLAIVGPDAMAAGLAFAQSGNPLFIFDVAANRLSSTRASFNALTTSRKLDAFVRVLEERVPHRRRLDLAIEVGKGAGAVNLHGMTAAAVGELPRDRLFPVFGEKMPDGWSWRRVWIEFERGLVSQRRLIGFVSVDEARIMATDADALGLWDDVNPSDGKADVVFWGRDAEQVAQETQAPVVDGDGHDGVYGWLDMPVDDAERRAAETLALQSQTKRFAVDLRPHTHQWAMMSQVRRTATSSGQLDLGGARVCMFDTLLGDGQFPAYAEFDGEGRILRASVEFAWEEDESFDGGADPV